MVKPARGYWPRGSYWKTSGVSRSCCSSIAKSHIRWCLKLAVSRVSWAERGKNNTGCKQQLKIVCYFMLPTKCLSSLPWVLTTASPADTFHSKRNRFMTSLKETVWKTTKLLHIATYNKINASVMYDGVYSCLTVGLPFSSSLFRWPIFLNVHQYPPNSKAQNLWSVHGYPWRAVRKTYNVNVLHVALLLLQRQLFNKIAASSECE